MYSLFVLQFLVASVYCSIKCKDGNSGECTADEFCYELSSTDENSECKIIRGCLKTTFGFPDTPFKENFLEKQKSDGLFKVCGTDNCNNRPADCNPKGGDGGVNTAAIILGLLCVVLFITAAVLGFLLYQSKK